MKKIYFISGQSRSGSELLCNILAQNPKFKTTTTSGILDVILNLRNFWDTVESFRATPDDKAKLRVMKAMLQSFHEGDIVFDKSRGWVNYLELAEKLLDHEPKVLVPVRDMRQVLSSWEKLYRKNAVLRESSLEKTDFFNCQTTQGRCDKLLENSSPVGSAHNRIYDALQRGWSKNMFFVDYDDLVEKPKEVMELIYKFLGEDYYEHDFNNVKKVTKSNDLVFGMPDLHKIRKKVEPQKHDWKEVLGEWADKYKEYNFWKHN